MTHQTWKFGKAIRLLFADRVTYIQLLRIKTSGLFKSQFEHVVTDLNTESVLGPSW